jgi:hypothetical protein
VNKTIYHDTCFSVIQKIFKVVDDHVAEDTLIKELNMSSLPTLSKKFIELLDLLVLISYIVLPILNVEFIISYNFSIL